MSGKLPEKFVCFLLAWIFFNSKNACQDADYISVENWHRLVEGDAANCTGGITSDSRQCQNVLNFFWKFSVMLFQNQPCRLLQIPGAGVIAQTFPQFVDFVRACICGGFNRRQFSHPAFPIRHDRFDLCLLEHDFGNPDCVRIARAPPRQVAGVFGKPIQQKRDELLQFRILNFWFGI